MVRTDDFSFWRRRFHSPPADRAILDVRGHTLRRSFLYGARADRAAFRHYLRAAAGDVSRFCATARSRLGALFHLATFQTHARFCHCTTREISRRKKISEQLGPSRLLE